MASFAERAPRERETLIYDTPDQAQEFREGVEGRIEQQPSGDVTQPRQAVSESLADEFAAAGHAVSALKSPWEHTPEEHAEAQGLTDIAFNKNLEAALAAARRSPNFPRNLDLLHDILTGELYESLREHRANRQPLGGWLVTTISLVLVALILGTLLLIFA